MIKQDLFDEVMNLQSLLNESCDHLWHNPELSGKEEKSSKYFKDILVKEGFKISQVEKLPYAFMAEYGSGSPVIGFLGEYDALPNLSQKCACEKAPEREDGVGHACGHNLLGTAQLIGAIAMKRYIEKSKIKGTVRFYGCPEEESLCGKVKMCYYHMFDGLDAALSWHPMDVNITHDKAYLANMSAKFHFAGRTSHAAFAPHVGRSAYDAVELMDIGANYLREHVIDKTRIHYAPIDVNFAPNIVPDKAGVYYYVRAPKISDVTSTMDRIDKIAHGAAMMTETEVKIEKGCGCCEFKENNAFADLNHDNLIEADVPKYTEEEIDFAKKLQSTVAKNIVENTCRLYDKHDEAIFNGVGNRHLSDKCTMTASSDTGDVSYFVPTGLFTVACWPMGVSPHTWQAAASAGHSIGKKGALYAAKVLAGSCFDLMTKPQILDKIKKEFEQRKASEYKPLYDESMK